MTEDRLIIADKEFDSRLLIGTGKFASSSVMAQVVEAAGAEIVTVALRRVDINNQNDDMLAAILKMDPLGWRTPRPGLEDRCRSAPPPPATWNCP